MIFILGWPLHMPKGLPMKKHPNIHIPGPPGETYVPDGDCLMRRET